jgi:cold shock protein
MRMGCKQRFAATGRPTSRIEDVSVQRFTQGGITMSTRRSVVKWFDAKKGYGFIHHPDGGDDIFVHYSTIASDRRFKTLRTGQTVDFDLEDGPKGLHAYNVQGHDEVEEVEESHASSSVARYEASTFAPPPSN